jgi:hypothetical protein
MELLLLKNETAAVAMENRAEKVENNHLLNEAGQPSL